MTYVITSPCVGTCDTACIPVCPMDCIHGPLSVEEIQDLQETHGAQAPQLKNIQLYIDPEACIDCGACLPECPVEAIYEDDELPDWDAHAAERNAAFFERP